MQADLSYRNAWHRTVQLLQTVSNAAAQAETTQATVLPEQPEHRVHPHASLTVGVVERLTKVTAAITWSDPTSCCYGYQLWQVSRARETGRCALTGEIIQRGDNVYRPRASRIPAVNQYAMILARMIEEAPLETV
jgi:hypothetical protein